MDTPASSASPRLASTSPSTKRGKQREGHGPAAVKRRRKDRKTEKSEKVETPKKEDTKDLDWLRKRD